MKAVTGSTFAASGAFRLQWLQLANTKTPIDQCTWGRARRSWRPNRRLSVILSSTQGVVLHRMRIYLRWTCGISERQSFESDCTEIGKLDVAGRFGASKVVPFPQQRALHDRPACVCSWPSAAERRPAREGPLADPLLTSPGWRLAGGPDPLRTSPPSPRGVSDRPHPTGRGGSSRRALPIHG